MKVIRLLFLICGFVSNTVGATEGTSVFSPAPGVKAIVTIDRQSLSWDVHYGTAKNQGRVDIDTEKSIHLDINDYDFSGHLGFAVWHVDDGMGSSSIYRVFTFSPTKMQFIEQGPTSLCGDEFINLTVDMRRRVLLSTFWDENIPNTCATRLPRTK